jgi:hypothetical protein
MRKTIVSLASLFRKKSQPKGALSLEKQLAAPSEPLFDEHFHRLPGFPQGFPVIPVDLLIQKNEDMIKQIILARGLAGPHNKADVEAKIMAPIRHLAEMTHLLPASEKHHFKLPGGLFAFSLEVALFAIRYAERRILTRATPEIRKEEESLWAHAAFLTGLFSEAITTISKLAVYSDELGIDWHPGIESLYEWLQRNNLKRYQIRWSHTENSSMVFTLAGKAIKTEQVEILARGEKAIYTTLFSALCEQQNFNNPLAKINEKVKYKLMERDAWSYADRYGKPLAGMHLEPWLIDAMRHLVQKKRWQPNEENGRIWHGLDGVFLVWPLAASDMQQELKLAESPFIPSTQEILAEIMLDAGIIVSNAMGSYLFDIAIPVAESAEKKPLEALKLARYEILFVKDQPKPIEDNLLVAIEEDDDEDLAGNESAGKTATGQSQTAAAASQDNASFDTSGAPPAEETASPQVSHDEYDPDIDYDTRITTKSAAESPGSTSEKIDLAILFGKPEAPAVEPKEELPQPAREEDPDLEALFNGETDPSAVNLYDADYASDYQSDAIDYRDFPLAETDVPEWVESGQADQNQSQDSSAEAVEPEKAEETLQPLAPATPAIAQAETVVESVPLTNAAPQAHARPEPQGETLDAATLLSQSVAAQYSISTKAEEAPESVSPNVAEAEQTRKPLKDDGQKSLKSKHSKQPEENAKNPTSAQTQSTEIDRADPNNNDDHADLLAALIGSGPKAPKADPGKPQEAARRHDTVRVEDLFSSAPPKSTGDPAARAGLILARLKKLPDEHLEPRPGGITKVAAIGLKNTKLELKECTAVLRAAGLLELIDGYETGLDSTGKAKSRYFLVKADLSNGQR